MVFQVIGRSAGGRDMNLLIHKQRRHFLSINRRFQACVNRPGGAVSSLQVRLKREHAGQGGGAPVKMRFPITDSTLFQTNQLPRASESGVHGVTSFSGDDGDLYPPRGRRREFFRRQ